MHTGAKLAKAGLVAAAAIAVIATVGVGQSRSQVSNGVVTSTNTQATSCPSTAANGCNVAGITQPNGLDICQGTGTNVHKSDTTADYAANNMLWTTQLCNTQPIDPATWVYGPNYDLTLLQAAAPFWNKVMVSMTQGLTITGTRWADPYGSDYCATAVYQQGTNDFNWADEMHSAIDNSGLWAAWEAPSAATYCGLTQTALAERGAFGSSLDEREAQHDADGGGDVFMRPVTSVRDAQEAVFWTFWPPFGHRSLGFSTGQYNTVITANGDAPYRSSYNMNIVMMAVIQGRAGAEAANEIAALDGIDALVIDRQDMAKQAQNFSDVANWVAKVTAAASKNKKYLCTLNWSATPATISCTGPALQFGGYWPNRRLDANGMPAGSPTTFASLGKE